MFLCREIAGSFLRRINCRRRVQKNVTQIHEKFLSWTNSNFKLGRKIMGNRCMYFKPHHPVITTNPAHHPVITSNPAHHPVITSNLAHHPAITSNPTHHPAITSNPTHHPAITSTPAHHPVITSNLTMEKVHSDSTQSKLHLQGLLTSDSSPWLNSFSRFSAA